ncbi:MAG TPA: hypothetical protein VIH59_37035 [Candidatus Tectomicrobia bacterium]|jgi:hypothetical protein
MNAPANNGEHMYIVYDERARSMPIDEADVLHATHDLEAAKAYAREHRGVVYAYHISAEGELINGECVYCEPDEP